MSTRRNDARTRAAQGKVAYQGMNWVRKDLRLAIYLRDGMACMWCGSSIEDGAQLTLDHVQCHAHGGSNKPSNLVTCCHKCNSVRADRSIEEFAEATAAYLNHGITAQDILTAIREHTTMDIKPYRNEAKSILNRRPSWQAALVAAAK